MLDPRAADLLDRVWQAHASPDYWILTSKGLKFGDLYMVMTLMDRFRQRVARSAPTKMLAISEGHMAIMRLFPTAFDEVHLLPVLADVSRENFQLWCRARDVDHFGPGNMLYLHPSYYTHGPFDLMVAPTNPPLTFIDLCKIGLRLPSGEALSRPRISPEARREAARLANASGVTLGRSLVLFPYAQSSPQNAGAHFAALAARAAAGGLTVLTSIAGAETAIEGTTPVRIPFDLLSAFCELAGAALVVRSGVADILAASDCRKIVIYATRAELRNYSIIDMGTAQSADELVLRCEEIAPEKFADRIWPLIAEPRSVAAQLADIPSYVREYFDQIDSWDGKAAVAGWQPFQVRHLRGMRGLVLGEGWADIEDWGVWSLGERASLFLKNPFPHGVPHRPGASGQLEIELSARAAVSAAQPQLAVRLTLGSAAAQAAFDPESRHQRPTLIVPGDLTSEPSWRLDIAIDGPSSPYELSGGTNPDRRATGIGVEAVSIRPRRLPVTAMR
jgi:hypothetical protein